MHQEVTLSDSQVNEDMETSVKDVFAAGDVCSVNWDQRELWIQMRLWTQAHQMGRYAAHSVASRFTGSDHKMFFNFEVFSHVTSLFGHKVVLLGLFNGQRLQQQYKILLKVEEGKHLIKLILKEGRVKGAVLIGDTGLEETIENLIISQLDVSRIEDNLLDPDIDIEDYFD
jgi:small subunit ribosomal protein S18b